MVQNIEEITTNQDAPPINGLGQFIALAMKVYTDYDNHKKPPSETDIQRADAYLKRAGLQFNIMQYVDETMDAVEALRPHYNRLHPQEAAEIFFRYAPNISNMAVHDRESIQSLLGFLASQPGYSDDWFQAILQELRWSFNGNRAEFERYIGSYNLAKKNKTRDEFVAWLEDQL
jgi:hypothetical protein